MGSILAGSAWAHEGGLPSVAQLLTPSGIVHADGSTFDVVWVDDDYDGEESYIEVFYSATIPPTFNPWEEPQGLQGDVIEERVAVSDPSNSTPWSLGDVPAGVWWLWTRTHDTPWVIVVFSPGVVVVEREGQAPQPAVVLLEPEVGMEIADAHHVVRYTAYDPDGTGRVRIEATQKLDGSDLQLIGADLPPEAEGEIIWDTAELPEGDWLVRATVEDDRGASFSAWGRYFVRVYHLGGGGDRDVGADVGSSADTGKTPDAAGPSDSSGAADDLAGPRQPDTGDRLEDPEDPSPSCTCAIGRTSLWSDLYKALKSRR